MNQVFLGLLLIAGGIVVVGFLFGFGAALGASIWL